MRIAILGLGYVGTSLTALLSPHHEVGVYDVNDKVVEQFYHNKSPIRNAPLNEAIAKAEYRPTFDPLDILEKAECVIVCVPTDYDESTHRFNLDAVEESLATIHRYAPDKAIVVIRSTVPVGYTSKKQKQYPNTPIFFSPEFLRESSPLEDNLHPSRIVVGCDEKYKEQAKAFADILLNASENKDTPTLITGLKEAEAIKLFSNTYLALRVAYFNELDTYAMHYGLSTKDIIDGVCLDPRIGQGYNNPSFGYGGYCLPKDTKQLLHNFESVPQNLIEAIVKSNETRKKTIVREIIDKAHIWKKDPVIGIYRLTSKVGADNLRQSAMLDIAQLLIEMGENVLIYEPLTDDPELPLTKDVDTFLEQADLIVANRLDETLKPHMDKVFTRDLFGNN